MGDSNWYDHMIRSNVMKCPSKFHSSAVAITCANPHSGVVLIVQLVNLKETLGKARV
jgi:hypothetical protein